MDANLLKFPEGILGVVIVVAIVAVLLWGEVKLSEKEKPWPGLVPMGLLAAAVIVSYSVVIVNQSQIDIVKKTVEMDGGNTAQMYLRENRQGEIICYSELKVFDSKGKQIDEGNINLMDLQQEDYGGNYADIFQEMTGGRESQICHSVEEETVKDPRYMISGERDFYYTIPKKGILYVFLYMGVPMTAIYLVKRRQVKAEKIKAELRRIEIESL